MEDLSGKRLFLLDMDGTIYLGDRLFDGCLDFLRHVREMGGRYIFMTNNSSKSVQDYVKKLNRLGIAAEHDDFLSSSQATAAYLTANHADDTIYVLGTRSLKEELHSHGLRVVDTLQDGISCLTVGFDTELTFAKLEDACRLLLHDIASVSYTHLGNPFVEENTSCFRKIAVACALVCLIYIVKSVLLFTYGSVVIAVVFLIGCLFCLTLKDIFKQAIALKEENDLTI